jgi:aminoglycoside 6'-N-acetyltransferase I
MIVRNLQPDDEAGIGAAALIAQAAFAHITYCDTLEEALREVQEALKTGKICLAAYSDSGEMLGWIGGQHNYARVWELHPLAIDPNHQRRSIGRTLFLALDERIAEAGGLTIFLGTDDEFGGTNLYGRELYPDVLAEARRLESVADHPFVFYQKLGFVVTGLVPDANGFGKPDILMCKRVGKAS